MPPRDFLSTLGKALNTRQTWEADIETRFTVVRPQDSRGLTVVRSQCNEQELVVSNRAGLTFAPGASVMVGSNTGRPGKSIIAGAPPGRMGASGFAPEVVSRTYGSAPVVPTTCPVSRTGRSYLGVYNDEPNETLYAYIYADGGYVSTLASYDYSGDGLSLEVDPHFQRAHAEGDVVVFYSSAGSGWQVCTWDVGANTLAVLEVDPPAFAGPIVTGTDIYFSSWDAPFLQLYRVDLYAAGSWNEVTARAGSAYEDTSGFLSVPDNLSHSGGVNFDAPAFWFDTSTEVRIPYYASGAWTVVTGREVLAGSDDPGTGNDGYAITGSRSMRITYGPGFAAKLGILPAGPGTPEVSLLPSDWTPANLYNLAISPNGTEFSVFYDATGGTTNQLLRLGVGDNFAATGCTPPTFEVEQSPDGFVPAYMLCRDH